MSVDQIVRVHVFTDVDVAGSFADRLAKFDHQFAGGNRLSGDFVSGGNGGPCDAEVADRFACHQGPRGHPNVVSIMQLDDAVVGSVGHAAVRIIHRWTGCSGTFRVGIGIWRGGGLWVGASHQ